MENQHNVEWIKTTYMDAHKPKTLKHVEAVADTAVWLAEIPSEPPRFSGN